MKSDKLYTKLAKRFPAKIDELWHYTCVQEERSSCKEALHESTKNIWTDT